MLLLLVIKLSIPSFANEDTGVETWSVLPEWPGKELVCATLKVQRVSCFASSGCYLHLTFPMKLQFLCPGLSLFLSLPHWTLQRTRKLSPLWAH